MGELTKRKIDILIATETWLQDSKQDETWVSTCKLGSSSFQIFTKETEAAEEEGALPSLQTIITKYHNKKMCMLTPALSTTFGTHN